MRHTQREVGAGTGSRSAPGRILRERRSARGRPIRRGYQSRSVPLNDVGAISSRLPPRRRRLLVEETAVVAGFNRTGWPTSVGIGGRLASEAVAGFPRNTQGGPLFYSRERERELRPELTAGNESNLFEIFAKESGWADQPPSRRDVLERLVLDGVRGRSSMPISARKRRKIA
jgi:hypothetical protein